MRISIIDLGTNAIRCDIYEVRGSNYRRMIREREMIRLGDGVFIKKKLGSENIGRALRAFLRFHLLGRLLHVYRTFSVGTSAMRDAKDSKKLIIIRSFLHVLLLNKKRRSVLFGCKCFIIFLILDLIYYCLRR